jgi:hypothetical protein
MRLFWAANKNRYHPLRMVVPCRGELTAKYPCSAANSPLGPLKSAAILTTYIPALLAGNYQVSAQTLRRHGEIIVVA